MQSKNNVQHELGATIIEAALTFIVFIALLALVIDGGRYFWFRAMMNEVTDAVLRDTIGVAQQQGGFIDPSLVHTAVTTRLAAIGFNEGIKSCLMYTRRGSTSEMDLTPNVSDLKLEVSLYQPCLLCKIFPNSMIELLRSRAIRITATEILSINPTVPATGSSALILMAEAKKTGSGPAADDEYWRNAEPCGGILTGSTP